MIFDTPTQTVLYSIEEAIKEYRKFSQRHIAEVIPDITVDQCLILIVLGKNNRLSQREIANLIFKDNASITRMIELMVKKEYLSREINEQDRRKFNLQITQRGQEAIELLGPAISKNREAALKGISVTELAQLYALLQKIIRNCNSND